MILDSICNSSADLAIETAIASFISLSLADFHVENIEDFALRLIKIMQGGYTLPYSLGSDLIVVMCCA